MQLELTQPMPEWARRELLNQWLSLRCRSLKSVGSVIWDACQGSSVNPLVMACIGYVHSKKFMDRRDIFACGLSGKLNEQIVNASIQYQNVTFLDLKITGREEIEINLAYDSLVTWMRSSQLKITRWKLPKKSIKFSEPGEAEQPTLPIDTQGGSQPVEPTPVLEWWRCPRCYELNPPLIEYCTNARCRAKNPRYEAPKAPREPKVPKPKVGLPGGKIVPVWLVKFAVTIGTLSTMFGLIKWLLPKPVALVLASILEVIKIILHQLGV